MKKTRHTATLERALMNTIAINACTDGNVRCARFGACSTENRNECIKRKYAAAYLAAARQLKQEGKLYNATQQEIIVHKGDTRL